MNNLEEPWGQYVYIDEELGTSKNKHKHNHYPITITPYDINNRYAKKLQTINENKYIKVNHKVDYSRGFYTLNRYCFGLLNLYFAIYSFYKSFY